MDIVEFIFNYHSLLINTVNFLMLQIIKKRNDIMLFITGKDIYIYWLKKNRNNRIKSL